MALTKEQAEQVEQKVGLFPPHRASARRHPDGGWVVDLHLERKTVELETPERAARALVALHAL